MANPLVEVRHGANPFVPVLPGVPFVATAGATLDIRLADTAGVVTWEIQCIDSDETSTVLPVTRNAPPAMSATASIPAGSGKAWLFRSRVNNGKSNNRGDPTLTFKVHVPAPNGLMVGTTNETYEGSTTHGWLGPINQAIRTAGLTAMPTGTGIVTTSGGTGATLPYGVAYSYARMNAAGTAMEWVEPIVPSGDFGALRMFDGQIMVNYAYRGGTYANEYGELSVVCAGAGGLELYPGSIPYAQGVGLKLHNASGFNSSGLALSGSGVRVVFDSTMVTSTSGIGVDITKFAALSGGKTTAAQARGMTVRTFDAITSTSNVATTASPTAMLSLSPTLAIGEVLEVFGLLASRTGTTNDFADLVISSAAAGGGTVYSTIAANWGTTACSLHAQYVVQFAGVHHITLRANHATTSFNVGQRRLSYKVFAQ